MLQDNDEAEFVIKALNWELAGLDSAPACATDVLRGHGVLCFDEIHPCAESQLEAWMPSDPGRQTRLTHWLNIIQVYLENSNGM